MSLELVLISGVSGSGKTMALHALEDAGFNCIDNLPPELLLSCIELSLQHKVPRQAVAIDVRSAQSLPLLPDILQSARRLPVRLRLIFLDAQTRVLVQRFSETRRRHPLSVPLGVGVRGALDLTPAIESEREMLDVLRENAHVIDTSLMQPSDLQSYIKSLLDATWAHLTLLFESFAFKRGIPMHADFVFDARMLPNPYHVTGLRLLSGSDAPVADWMAQHDSVAAMISDIESFLRRWLPHLAGSHRSYVTVAIGCTGGQHRSVHLVERLASLFAADWVTIKHHREQRSL